MTVDEAWTILRVLQAGIDARDRDALVALLDERAVLIGTSGYTADPSPRSARSSRATSARRSG